MATDPERHCIEEIGSSNLERLAGPLEALRHRRVVLGSPDGLAGLGTAEFKSPRGMATDSDGMLLCVADTGNLTEGPLCW